MATARDQHLVPQMMIKRFAGNDGRLAELIKPNLAFGTQRRAPKGILFGKNFYRDRNSDLDDELLKPIEQEFALIYPSLAFYSAPPFAMANEGGLRRVFYAGGGNRFFLRISIGVAKDSWARIIRWTRLSRATWTRSPYACSSTIRLQVLNFFKIRSAVMRRSETLACAGTVCRYSRSSVMYAWSARNNKLTNASTRPAAF